MKDLQLIQLRCLRVKDVDNLVLDWAQVHPCQLKLLAKLHILLDKLLNEICEVESLIHQRQRSYIIFGVTAL